MRRRHSIDPHVLTTPRAAGIAGLVFSTLTFTYQLFIWTTIPAAPLGSTSELITHAHMLSLALKLVPFAGIAFLWFMGVIRDRIGALEDRFFATVFLGSGLLYVAMLFVSAAIASAILQALKATEETLVYGDAYTVARTEIFQLSTTYAAKMAGVFMITTSTISKRTQIMPRFLVWCGFVCALLLLLSTRVFAWSLMIFPVWVMVISVHILLDSLPTHGETDVRSEPQIS